MNTQSTDAATVIFDIEVKLAKVKEAGMTPLAIVMSTEDIKRVTESYALKTYLDTAKRPAHIKDLPVIISDFIHSIGIVV